LLWSLLFIKKFVLFLKCNELECNKLLVQEVLLFSIEKLLETFKILSAVPLYLSSSFMSPFMPGVAKKSLLNLSCFIKFEFIDCEWSSRMHRQPLQTYDDL